MFCFNKKRNRVIWLLYLCWLGLSWGLLLLSPATLASDIKVVFVSPQPKMPGFWQDYEDVMQSAAKQLNIDLHIIRSAGTDRFGHIAKLQQVTEMASKPDYVITMPRETTARKMFALLQSSDIKFFITNTELPVIVQEEIGTPGQFFQNWVGHLRPDDAQAGELVAEQLYAVMQQNLAAEKYSILAITGARDVAAVFERNQGLRRFLKTEQNSRLLQFVFTDWRYKSTLEKVPLIARRYPNLNGVWCASDEIAAAVFDGYLRAAMPDIPYLGAIDWSEEGLKRFQNGSLAVSVGGHFIEGGLILAAIRDHHDGIEFKTPYMMDQKLSMSVLNKDNYPLIEELVIAHNYDSLDFSKLSVSRGGSHGHWSDEYLQIIKNIQREPASDKL